MRENAMKEARTSSTPCHLRTVPGKLPPPWANMTRSLGSFSKMPPKMKEQIAMQVSMGMPTSQGSQYFLVNCSRGIFQGWMNTHAPNSSHAYSHAAPRHTKEERREKERRGGEGRGGERRTV